MILYIAAIMVGLSFCWIMYQGVILILGIERWRRGMKDPPDDPPNDDPPMVSIIVPAKNEERVIGRLLDGLLKLNYPKYEILIVEDGSTDSTPQICKRYARDHPNLIRYYHRERSEGKPSAINFAARKAKGEIIALYDADTEIPDPEVLGRMVSYFRDPEVDAVQGELSLTNPRKNIITRISEFTSTLRMILQHGKDRIGLFVSLCGNHQYVRKRVLEELGYWDPKALTEDIELSVRLSNRGYRIRYVPVRARSDAPPSIYEYFKQRMRWFRGFLQTISKHGRHLRGTLGMRADIWGTLLSPTISWIGLLGWVLALVGSFSDSGTPAATVLWCFGLVYLILTSSALVLISFTRPRNLIYVPIAYISWILESSVSIYAHLLELFRRPRKWTKTGRG